MDTTNNSVSSAKEARELYELKEKAAKWYAENGVPQKMEEVLNSMFYDNPSDVYGHLAQYFQGFAKPPQISKVVARPAIDSKAQLTIQTEVFCTINNKEKLVCTSLASSTNSLLPEVAKQEEKEEEDKERDENVLAAISYLNTDINNRLQGVDPTHQAEADDTVSKLIMDLKAAEDERLAKEAAEREAENEGGDEPEKKPSSAQSKDKPKSGGKGKGGKAAPAVVVTPDEPREKLLLGSGCVSAASQALCSTGSNVQGRELYEHVACLRFGQIPSEFRIPLPMVTMLQSGRSAPGKCNCVKEFMVVPKPGRSLKETLPQIAAIYSDINKAILNKNGVAAKNVTDTGALMVPIDRPEQGLDMIQESMGRVGVTPGEDFFIALNLAGQEIFDYDTNAGKEKVPQSFPLADRAVEKGKYEVITGQQKVPEDLVDFWAELLGRYPAVIAIIDPFRKQEDRHWMSLCERISDRCYVLGDQVWHRPGLLKDEELTDTFKSSGVVYKLEQMNTISDILLTAKKMEEAKCETVLTTAVGETTDTFLADMAVGMNARFIKVGAPCRGERVAKLNRLLSIESCLQDCGKLAYHGDFSFPHVAPPPPPEPEEGEPEEEEVKKEPAKKK